MRKMRNCTQLIFVVWKMCKFAPTRKPVALEKLLRGRFYKGGWGQAHWNGPNPLYEGKTVLAFLVTTIGHLELGFPTQHVFLQAQICTSSAQQKLIARSFASSAFHHLHPNLRNKLNKLPFKSEKISFLICKIPVLALIKIYFISCFYFKKLTLIKLQSQGGRKENTHFLRSCP